MKAIDLVIQDGFSHIVIAPHPDDETIGALSLLLHGEQVSVFTGECEMGSRRPYEQRKVLERVNVLRATKNREPIDFETNRTFTYNIESLLMRRLSTFGRSEEEDGKKLVVWSPDPVTEFHPYHRFAGNACQEITFKLLGREDILFGHYSINMQAPYIHELNEKFKEVKRELLGMYMTQTGYLMTHTDCFYFEGARLI